MIDNIHSFDWLIAYFVYNNTFYALDEIIKDKGIFDSEYFTMQNQTNYLFNLIEQLPPDERIKIIIVNLDYDFIEKKTVFSIVEKNGGELKIKTKFTPEIDIMTSAHSIQHILNTIKVFYKYKKICITTFGHGSFFGINVTNDKLYSDITKNENSIDFGKINTFNDFVNDNKNLFKPSAIKERVYLSLLSDISKSLINQFNEKKIENKLYNTLILLNKRIENAINQLDTKKRIKTYLIKRWLEKFNVILSDKLNYEKGLLSNIETLKILTNKEFNEGIALSIKKVNVLVMYNCLMQNIYTQYEFRDTVDYLVAPVGGIGFPGYDYEGTYNNLRKNISISTKDFANTFILTLQTGTLQKMEPFKQNFRDRLFLNSVEINKQGLENLKVCYDNWLLAYEELAVESSYYDTIADLNVIPGNELLAIVSDTISTCFNLSSKCVTVLSVVEFYVFVNSFLYILETKNSLLKNKTNLINSTKDLINIFSSFSNVTNGPMDEFYESNTRVSFEDVKYRNEPEKLGIGIIFNRYKEDSLNFHDRYFDITQSSPKEEIPTFLLGTKTGELFLKN